MQSEHTKEIRIQVNIQLSTSSNSNCAGFFSHTLAHVFGLENKNKTDAAVFKNTVKSSGGVKARVVTT